ncbi:MAG: hypothetical protein R3A44_43930 [Caldilineaceae bacterium]
MLTRFFWCIALLLILTGCTAKTEREPVLVEPTPTVIPLLSVGAEQTVLSESANQGLLDVTPDLAVQTPAESTAIPTSTVASQTAPITTQEPALHEVYIFEDQLDSNWELAQSFGMKYDLQNTSHWFEPLDSTNQVDSGAVSISISPEQDFGELYFTVRPDAAQSYPRGQVVGLSFWLNSGGNFLDTEALAITIVGSNNSPIWSTTDNPIQADGKGLYSETRLYHLELNRSIPPNTWAPVIVIFKELLFDPEFEYLTGFYIKNDEGYNDTFYIDNIATIWQTEAAQ